MSKAQKVSNGDVVNGLDVGALKQVIEDVGKDPSQGVVEFRVKTR